MVICFELSSSVHQFSKPWNWSNHLDAECLHYLEHIHNALCLATLNGINEWTEYHTHQLTVSLCVVYVCVLGGGTMEEGL